MDSYEFNKIAGWVLAAAIAVLGLSILTGFFFPVHHPETTAYEVQGVEEEGAGAGGADAKEPISVYLQTASAAKGEAQFRKCAACHTIEKGGASGIGPNIYGILGAQHAHIASFNYSSAMAETKGETWNWDSMSDWIENPRAYIPGNKMSFAGIGRPQDRADLLLYLNNNSDNPLPIPAPPAPEEEAVADNAEAGPDAEATEAADGGEATVSPETDSTEPTPAA